MVKKDYLNEINVQIEKCNDLSQRVLMYRLYTEYLKNLNKDTTEQTDKKLFIKLLSSYSNITKEVVSKDYLDNGKNYEKVYNRISNDYLLLKSYFSNFELKDKNQTKGTIDLITEMECLLKLKVSFPESLERCLNKEIEKNEEKSKKENSKRMS